MRRFVWGTTLVALLGLGGLALGQEGLIVNPWKPSGSMLSLRSPWAGRSQPKRGPIHVTTYEVTPPSTPASVVPLGPLEAHPSAIEPVDAFTYPEVIDPWRQPEPVPGTADHRLALHTVDRNWAHQIQEIVDPWASGPLAVAIDPSIVDPWASSTR
jgi:hypothetical protein